jgi:16S rRNA (guanine527-N7)-methyltransferase
MSKRGDADVPGSGLVGVLSRSRELGFLGPGAVEDQLVHSRAAGRLAGPFAGHFLDLGAGGGLPGLAFLELWPESTAVLLDAQERRCRFLQDALAELGWESRAEVRCGRAETLAREPGLRGEFDLVVARGFGRPAVTAECAVGFLGPGGRLVVTEPPAGAEEGSRWEVEGLAALGFRPANILREQRAGVAEMVLGDPVSERWPRRDGVPGKRPLW